MLSFELDIERVFQAIKILEQELHKLAPYSPTPPDLIGKIVEIISRLLRPLMTRSPQNTVLEAGCGKGDVAKVLARSIKAYTICLEIDSELLKHSKNREPALELVNADLNHPPLRKIDITYAYLLPTGLQKILDTVKSNIIISLDYKASRENPTKTITLGNHHELHIYIKRF